MPRGECSCSSADQAVGDRTATSRGRPINSFNEFLLRVDSSRGRRSSISVPDRAYNKKKYLDGLLNLNVWSVENLAIQPGEQNFEIWFVISSYFPLIAGTLGPVSNMANIVSLIDSWRVHKVTGEKEQDFPWLLKLNGISVMFALISNAALLMNTKNKVRYTIGQTISICGWLIAATILLVIVVVADFLYFKDTDFEPSQGYWFAVFTTVLYYACFMVLLINEIGFLTKKYPPSFNIDDAQKNLMVLVIVLMFFLLCSSAIFSRLMTISFADALYFLSVTILTVGLGDLTPSTAAGMTLILLWSVIGLLLLALIISTIRELVIFSSSSTFYWNRLEKHRKLEVAKMHKTQNSYSNKESFEKAGALQKKALLLEKVKSLFYILLMFITFWMIGAAIFQTAEDWGFGVACYFCFLCLLTIGYGNPSPQTYCGKAFFVIWGLAAVPLMTILISNMSDILFSSLKDTSNYSLLDPLFHLMTKAFAAISFCFDTLLGLTYKYMFKRNGEPQPAKTDPQEVLEDNLLDDWAPGMDSRDGFYSPLGELPPHAPETTKELHHLAKVLRELCKMTVASIESPTDRLSYEQWEELAHLTEEDEKMEMENFWLEEDTPFRFPFRECHYFQFKYLFYIEYKLKKLIKEYELSYADERLRQFSNG